MKNKKWLALLAFIIGLTSFISSAGASEVISPQQRLAIYYGWPSVVNGAAGNVATASNTFAQFDIIVFGYVNLGCTPNPDTTAIKQKINKWSGMNVYGVFLDCAGFDYGVTRKIQNDVTDYAHGKGLKVFMNAWNPDDIGGNLNEKGVYQPSRAGDWYLAESRLISNNSYLSISDWSAKADKCLTYKRNKGIETAVIATNAANSATNR